VNVEWYGRSAVNGMDERKKNRKKRMEGMDGCDDDDENGRSGSGGREAAGGANGSVASSSTSFPLSQPPFYIYFSYILIHIHSHHFSPFLIYFTLKYPVYFIIFIEIKNNNSFIYKWNS
jgi:hypothetical protein